MLEICCYFFQSKNIFLIQAQTPKILENCHDPFEVFGNRYVILVFAEMKNKILDRRLYKNSQHKEPRGNLV